GRAGCANFTIDVKACAENWRVADASWDFPRETARRSYAADFALRIYPVAIDRAIDTFTLEQTFGDHFFAHATHRFGAFVRIKIMLRVDAAFPFQPHLARMFRVQIILDLEPN